MKLTAVRLFSIATCFVLVASVVHAQEKVHALSGTVKAINAKYSMMEIDTDNGSSPHFRWDRPAGTKFDFDKTVSADAVPADKFTTNGRHVIVYYYGDDMVRTVVAVHDLGDIAVQESKGAVVLLNRHDHLLTIKDESGKELTFQIGPKTVADTATGVSLGFKFDLSKGDHVRVTSTKEDGNETALLIAPAY